MVGEFFVFFLCRNWKKVWGRQADELWYHGPMGGIMMKKISVMLSAVLLCAFFGTAASAAAAPYYNSFWGYYGGLRSPYGSSAASVPQQAAASPAVERVIQAGMRYLGTPYEFGSNRSSTRTFDCSDFVRRAFIEGADVTLPGDSRKQGAYVREQGDVKTNWRQLQRGDLMFFMSYEGSEASDYRGVEPFKERITHVAIYLGNGKMLHTYSNDSGGVRTDDVDGAWTYRFLYGGSAM